MSNVCVINYSSLWGIPPKNVVQDIPRPVRCKALMRSNMQAERPTKDGNINHTILWTIMEDVLPIYIDLPSESNHVYPIGMVWRGT